MTRIALAQTTSTDDLAANLARAESLVAEAAARGARLLALPEVFSFVGPRERKLEIAEPIEGPLVSRFRSAAARAGIMLLLGSFHERIEGDRDRVHNTSVLISDGGEVLAAYRKRMLFDVDLPDVRIRESDTIAPGTSPPPVVATAIGRLGLTICFDLRFSDLYVRLRRDGAEIVFVPSNFTAPTGAAHWEVMLRARAIEGQYWVVAPAQWGRHNPRYVSHGHSMVIDPWGRVTAERAESTGLLLAEIDLALVERVRRELPMRI